MAYPNRTSDITGQQRPFFELPYRSGNDKPKSLPYAPKSVNVTSPYLVGSIDVRWDNPAIYTENNGLQVLGVNVYRAYDAPSAAYVKINVNPVSILFCRDQTSKVTVDREDALPLLNAGQNPEGRWYFHTQHKQLTTLQSNATNTVTIDDILLEIDAGDGKGFQIVPAWKVDSIEGIVYLNTNRTYDPNLNIYKPPVLPNVLTGGIRVSYLYLNGLIATDINRKIYYKVTTIAFDKDKNENIETPLSEIAAISLYDMEKIDYIWAEGIRRNRYLLQQAGERVKVFLRKWNGIRCPNYNITYGTCKGVGLAGGCQICYGGGYVGGYEGPFDIIIAPPETEKMVNLLDAGLHIQYDWTTWTGPEPLLNDRDVVVRQNNDRFFISKVNYQGSRGAIYQQHFNIDQVDQKDPIYSLPIDGGIVGSIPLGWNAFREPQPSQASPQLPEKPEIEPGRLPIGRTVTFENIQSGG
jgi:hypothetical protein